jgi:hypothetical protein
LSVSKMTKGNKYIIKMHQDKISNYDMNEVVDFTLESIST